MKLVFGYCHLLNEFKAEHNTFFMNWLSRHEVCSSFAEVISFFLS